MSELKKIIDKSDLVAAFDDVMDFLAKFKHTTLVGFDPLGKMNMSSWYYDGTNAKVTRDWLAANWRYRNLHYHVNPHELGAVKASKGDIPRAQRVHADFDGRPGEAPQVTKERILGRLRDSPYPPTWTIFSGHGVNAIWELAYDLPASEIEAINYGLACAFGEAEGDACWDVSRVLRLPGTINWSSVSKYETKGQRPAASYLIEHVPTRVYDPATLPKKEPPSDKKKADEPARPPLKFDAVPLSGLTDPKLDSISDRCRLVLRDGEDSVDPDRWKGDRSRAVFYVVCELLRAEVDREVIAAILVDKRFGISKHVLDQRNVSRYVTRQLKRGEDATQKFGGEDEGTPAPTVRNVELALARQGIELRHDEFLDLDMVFGLPGYGPSLDDNAAIRLKVLLESKHSLHFKKEAFWDALTDIANDPENRFHPIRDMLDGTRWDGVDRTTHFIRDYMAGPDTELAQCMGFNILLAHVARVMEPGFKWDIMGVIQGRQGDFKSTALEVMAVNPEWFADRVPLSSGAKEMIEATQGKWICEDAELIGLNASNDAKSVLSRKVDRARMSYKRVVSERRRQFVMWGTTNETVFLTDVTGNRRFWAFKAGVIPVEKLRSDMLQIWAEVYAQWQAGKRPEVPQRLWEEAAQEISYREIKDEWEVELREELGAKEGWFLMRDVTRFLDIPLQHQDMRTSKRLGNILHRIGFQNKRARRDGRLVYVWFRENEYDKIMLGEWSSSGDL